MIDIKNILISKAFIPKENMILDMWTEKANDDVKYQRVAGQSEFDSF